MNATNDPVSTYGMEFLLHTITITIYIHTYIQVNYKYVSLKKMMKDMLHLFFGTAFGCCWD